MPELHQYIREYNLSAMANEKTDADGMAIFSDNGSPLPSGLYLVVGSRHRQNGYYYDTLPFLVMPTGNVLQAAPKPCADSSPALPAAIRQLIRAALATKAVLSAAKSVRQEYSANPLVVWAYRESPCPALYRLCKDSGVGFRVTCD